MSDFAIRNSQFAIRWLDYVLKEIESGIKDEPPVKIFVMGINEWRFEKEWPLARTRFTKYYFRSNGRIIRARFRESVWEPPNLLVPGTVYEYTVELLPTSNLFFAGHQIRVHLTSSNFPLWDRNPNTGNDQGMDSEMQVAEQTIYHDRRYPSHIDLPIIPRG